MVSRRWFAGGALVIAGAISSLTSACSNGNDIVATQRSDAVRSPDGGFGGFPTVPCQAGTYAGTLFATPTDGGSKFPYSGRISFAITEERRGEFKVISDIAPLTGTGDDGTTSFKADIVDGSCINGTVDALLQNGFYTYSNVAAEPIPFDGTIKGHYDSESDFSGFIGRWTTTLHFGGGLGDILVSGTWSASRTN